MKTFVEDKYWAAEIFREDGSSFLSCGTGVGCAPALFPRSTNVSNHLKELRAHGFKCRRVKVRVTIQTTP